MKITTGDVSTTAGEVNSTVGAESTQIVRKMDISTEETLHVSLNPRHLDTAFSYVGTKEKTGKNDGKIVEMFLKSVGRTKGDAWCAAFVSYCMINSKVIYPTKFSGLARTFKTNKSIKASDVLFGVIKIKPGTLLIWEKGSTISGHVGFVISQVGKNKFNTIEGNTSSGTSGSQSDGDGVYKRSRVIQPANYFRITSFTEVKY